MAGAGSDHARAAARKALQGWSSLPVGLYTCRLLAKPQILEDDCS
jgi:hypothetical protein